MTGKSMLIQIYEIQTPREAEALVAMGVDHIGSVLLTAEVPGVKVRFSTGFGPGGGGMSSGLTVSIRGDDLEQGKEQKG